MPFRKLWKNDNDKSQFFRENDLQNGARMPPQIVPKSILGPPWTQICAKDGPREPPTTDVHDFLSILAPCLIDFGSIFDWFYMIFDPASQVRPTLESNGTSDERYESITIAEQVSYVRSKSRIDHDRRTPFSLFGLAGFRLRIRILNYKLFQNYKLIWIIN